jgi:hypothetical protein
MNKATRSTFGRHRLHVIIAFVISVILLLLLLSPLKPYERIHAKLPEVYAETLSQPKTPPPKYEGLHKWEANLPQHDLDLPFPEGRTGRYVKFSNQIVMLGFNNVLNEV